MTKKDKACLNDLFSRMPELGGADKKLVERAYYFAKKAHRGQKRLSGKPYFTHLLETTKTLVHLGMGAKTIAAGFLHDTVEDTKVTAKELDELFGKEIVFLVEGVTKLGKLKYHGLKRHVESLRKLFVAMAQDVRVIIIRLADRLHNMRTLEYIPETEKRERIALETLEIYVPIAHRLGISRIKSELEDLAFPYVYPEEYKKVQGVIKREREKNTQRLEKVAKTLKKKLAEATITNIHTDYRVKSFYSMYQKLVRYDMNVEKIYDIAALRIQVPTVDDCYTTLGIIHNRWKPLPGRIKDFIGSPKANGYQSLHTTVFTGDGRIIEIQIRTPEMHKDAEYGIASHVSYKEGGERDFGGTGFVWFKKLLAPFNNKNETPKESGGTNGTLKWVQDVAETQKDIDDPHTFIKSLKTDFLGDRIFVFTPKGEVVDLPPGACPVDFAYAIHTDIGGHVAGAKVNGKLVSLDTKLQNGDIITIQTKKASHPTRKWLDFTKTGLARRKIRGHIEKQAATD